MAVAAAIGVGADEAMEDVSGGGRRGNVLGGGHQANGRQTLAQRLSNKMKMMPDHSQGGPSAVLGEINRSIEKMSLTNVAASGRSMNCNVTSSYGMPQMPPSCQQVDAGQQQQQTTLLNDPQAVNAPRRGSDWTNSTEGYGSLRSSEQSMMSSSRRCSDVSTMSQVC